MSRARLRQALIAGDRSGETTPFGRDGFASQGGYAGFCNG
ncbi:type II toxin-antitoxin system ParD family antitoxin [Mycolicibacterium sp. SCSIO 43805]